MAKNKVEELDQENESEEVETKKSGLSTVKLIIIAVTLTLVLGGGLVGATIYFVGGNNNTAQNSSAKGDTEEISDADEEEDEEEEEEVSKNEDVGPPRYLSMNPKFVVSFSNQKFARFMQFSLEVMARDQEVIKQVEEHMPVIRSSLLMLFGGQQYEAMVTREGKEKLLSDTAEDINNTLQELTGVTELAAEVEAAYFNSFVIQ